CTRWKIYYGIPGGYYYTMDYW
nr:immunoglobulin heavy chain junction region [Mus musculus]